jgi:integrase/recombinase XerD
MENLVEDFLQYLRNERGQSENTQKTYKALLDQFVAWAKAHHISTWEDVSLNHLMDFLKQGSNYLLTRGS